MMESIEKLRKWVKSLYTPNSGELKVEGLDIADEIEAEIAERYMLLPCDADGVPIHINDRMENNERVARIVISDGEWESSVYLEKLSYPRVLHEHFCHEISHFNPRTIEDVLIDMLEAAVGYSDAHTDVALVAVEKYADELRELMEVDG